MKNKKIIIEIPKEKLLPKFRSVHKPTKQIKDKSVYSRKNKHKKKEE